MVRVSNKLFIHLLFTFSLILTISITNAFAQENPANEDIAYAQEFAHVFANAEYVQNNIEANYLKSISVTTSKNLEPYFLKHLEHLKNHYLKLHGMKPPAKFKKSHNNMLIAVYNQLNLVRQNALLCQKNVSKEEFAPQIQKKGPAQQAVFNAYNEFIAIVSSWPIEYKNSVLFILKENNLP